MENSTTQEHVEFTGWRRPLIGAQMLFVAFGAQFEGDDQLVVHTGAGVGGARGVGHPQVVQATVFLKAATKLNPSALS